MNVILEATEKHRLNDGWGVEGKGFYGFFRGQKGAKIDEDIIIEPQIKQTLEPSPKSRRPYSNWADNSMVVYNYRV